MIKVLINGRQRVVTDRDTVVYTGAGTGNSHVDVVAGSTDSAAHPAALKRTHRTVECQRGSMLSVSFVAAQPLWDENDRPEKNDCCVNQPGEHGPQRRQT